MGQPNRRAVVVTSSTFLLLLSAICLLCLPTVHAKPYLEGIDDLEQQQHDQPAADTAQGAAFTQQEADTVIIDSPLASSSQQAPKQGTRPVRPPPDVKLLGPYETAALVFLIVYFINLVLGRRHNRQIADAWSKTFTQQGGLLDKNFSHCEPLMQEAGNVFKFYATGRRHVQGTLASLQLRARQDVLSILWGVISPSEDLVVVEALMTEASMPDVVLAVATPRVMRRLVNSQPDISQYTRRVQPSREALPGWNHDRLHIQAEHSTIASELLNEQRVLQTLNATGNNAKSLKYFRSLHFTNEYSEGAYKRVLRFTFALPAPGNMEELSPLMALVPLFIDLVGTYKLSPELKRRAEAARAKAAEAAAAEEEARKARMEALALKKQEKLNEEKARIARLPPEERQRAEDKLQKRMMDKAMKKRIKRM